MLWEISDDEIQQTTWRNTQIKTNKTENFIDIQLYQTLYIWSRS